MTTVVFVGIGLYGGAVQAGVGLVMLAALTRAGYDLVTANVIKMLVTVAVTVIALPVFIVQGDVRWGPALVLTLGPGNRRMGGCPHRREGWRAGDPLGDGGCRAGAGGPPGWAVRLTSRSPSQ